MLGSSWSFTCCEEGGGHIWSQMPRLMVDTWGSAFSQALGRPRRREAGSPVLCPDHRTRAESEKRKGSCHAWLSLSQASLSSNQAYSTAPRV